VNSGTVELTVFETENSDLPGQEISIIEDMVTLDTIDTDDRYLIAVNSSVSDGNNDTVLYSMSKDLKKKQFVPEKKFSSGLLPDFYYRTVKISSNSRIGLIGIDDSLNLKFIVFDASKSNPSMVI
jgi:hypothetical protein